MSTVASIYLGLVHYLARRVRGRLPVARVHATPFDDLLQAGFLGLLEAAHAYDPARGVSFLSYARPRIMGAMLDLLGSADPRSKRERRARREHDAVEAELTGRLGRPPTVDELAEALGTTTSEVSRVNSREATA